MKRTSGKQENELRLKRRLTFVRTTIRQLTPAQLDGVNGGMASCIYTVTPALE